MSRALWGAVAVLVIIGLYFLAWHVDPLPGNHEAVGLGDNHIAHAVIGIPFLVGALLVFLRIRRAPTPHAGG